MMVIGVSVDTSAVMIFVTQQPQRGIEPQELYGIYRGGRQRQGEGRGHAILLVIIQISRTMGAILKSRGIRSSGLLFLWAEICS